MNRFKHLTLAVAMMVGAGVASAAGDTQTVQVIGRITPDSCELSLDNGGIFNYGNISVGTLSPTAANALGARQTPIHIECSGSIKVAVSIIDSMAGTADGGDGVSAAASVASTYGGTSAHSATYFGLGTTSDGTYLGMYLMAIIPSQTLIDGAAPAVAMLTADNGATYLPVTDGRLAASAVRFYTWGSALGTPVAFTTMSGTLEVSPAVKPTAKLPSGQAEDLSGEATLELRYL